MRTPRLASPRRINVRLSNVSIVVQICPELPRKTRRKMAAHVALQSGVSVSRFFASRQVSNGSRSVRAKAISMILRLRQGVVRSEGLDPNAASEDGRVGPAIQIQLSNGGEGAHPYSSDVKRPSFASSFTHFESRRRGAAGCRRWVERWLDYRALAERLRAADVHDLDHQGTVR